MQAIMGVSEAPAAKRRSAVQAKGLAARLQAVGGGVLRYGTVALLVYFGAFKFTATEAGAIQPLIAHSPFLSWLYGVLNVQAVSNLIGATELIAAALLAARPFAPRATVIGSVMAIGIFLTTLSFLATTPGVWARVPDFFLPIPSGAGGFILKDVFLLGAAVWSAGEALAASRSSAAAPRPRG